MAELDGSIRIGVVFDDRKITAEMDKLDQKLNRQTRSVQNQQNKVADLERQYRKLAKLETEPKSLKDMEKDLRTVQTEAAKLAEDLDKLNQLASIQVRAGGRVSPETQAELDEMTEKLAYADQRADALQRRIQEIKLDPTASDEARKLAEQLEAARGKLELLQKEAQATASAKEALATQADEMRDMAQSAQVADQRIVDLNRELQELMSGMMAAGIANPEYRGAVITTDRGRLPLFTHDPQRLVSAGFWLMDTPFFGAFCSVDATGLLAVIWAGLSNGVRPVFCIC